MMKRIVIALILLTSIFATASAQDYRQEAIDNLYNVAGQQLSFIARNWGEDYSVRSTDEGAIQVDTVDVGHFFVFSRVLYAGNSYVFGTAGDSDARDVDIYIYDENDNLIDYTENTGPTAAVGEITPRWTGPFYIVVELDSGLESWSYVGNILLWNAD